MPTSTEPDYRPEAVKNLEEGFNPTYAKAGADQAEAYANDSQNSSEVQQQEEVPYENTASDGGSQSGKFSLKGKSATGGVAGIILTAVFGLGLLSPGLLVMHFTETMLDAFNDQLTAMEFRSKALLKKKLQTTTLTGCTATSIRCKYKTMPNRYVKRLEKAGITVEGERKIGNRTKPRTFVFDGKQIAPRDLLNEMTKNPALRSAMRHGYNPKFASFSDHISTKFRTKFGISKNIDANDYRNRESGREKIQQVAAGTDNIGDGQKLTAIKDEEGKTTGYEDAEGKRYSVADGEAINNRIDEINSRTDLADNAGKSAAKSSVKGVLTASALGVGAVDTMCTGWTIIRVAGFAAKVYSQRQLIRYAYQIGTAAHMTKAGDATPEVGTFFGDLLTNTNSVGLSATDSAGYKYAAYGDIFKPGDLIESGDNISRSEITSESGLSDSKAEAIAEANVLTDETTRYVNGNLIPDNIMTGLINLVSKGGAGTQAADDACDFVKSWQGQVIVFGAAIVGAVVAVFSGGASLGWGAALNVSASISVAVAVALLTPKLIDMAKGEVITGGENGHQAGNAAASGFGGINAQASQTRGLGAQTVNQATEYAYFREDVRADYAEVARYETSPFDVTTRYSFAGGIIHKLIPLHGSMSQPSSAVSGLFSFVGQGVSSALLPSTHASLQDQRTKQEYYDQCDDPEYDEYDLATDPFCNVRYGLSPKALSIDPETVLDYMLDNNHIQSEESPSPSSDAYMDYIKDCIEREVSIGDSQTDDTGSGGKCVIGNGGSNEERNMMFRVFYIDQAIEEGFETGGYDETGTANGAGSQLRVASYNILGKSHTDASPGASNYSPLPDWDERIVKVKDNIITNRIDVIGFQEFEEAQRKYLKRHLTNYGLSTHGKTGDSIMWNTDKFTKVDQGTWGTVYFGPKNIDEPYVKLRDNSTGQEFYFMSLHDPVNNTGTNANTRYNNALKHLKKINELKSDAPVITVGDFNNGYRKGDGSGMPSDTKTAYCILSRGGMQHGLDALRDQAYKCSGNPRPDAGADLGSKIDHIYVSETLDVSNYFDIDKPQSGSDHVAIIADVVIPSGGPADANSGNMSVDGWQWPIAPAESKAGPCYGGSNGHAGMDINSGSNSTVYAMHDGVVEQARDADTDAAGHYIMIKASDGTYYSYEHLLAGSFKVSVGDTVKAGNPIAKMGATGNVQLGSSKAHLHIVMATTATLGSYGNLGTTFDPMKKLREVKPSGYNCT